MIKSSPFDELRVCFTGSNFLGWTFLGTIYIILKSICEDYIFHLSLLENVVVPIKFNGQNMIKKLQRGTGLIKYFVDSQKIEWMNDP